jgi:hypothetical protein
LAPWRLCAKNLKKLDEIALRGWCNFLDILTILVILLPREQYGKKTATLQPFNNTRIYKRKKNILLLATHIQEHLH